VTQESVLPKVYSNAKADLTIEVIPAARAAFPAIGTTVQITSTGTDDIKGALDPLTGNPSQGPSKLPVQAFNLPNH
jgi:hypothetical protein